MITLGNHVYDRAGDTFRRYFNDDGIHVFIDTTEHRETELVSELERLQAAIERINHFANGGCDMSTETRLRCIARECAAEKARTKCI